MHPKSSILAYLLFILFSFAIIPLLSSIYSLLIWYIPFIYLNFFITAAFGALLAGILNKLLRIGKVRSIKIANYFAICATIVAIYFIWSSYITLLYNAGETISSNASSYKFRGLSMTKTFFNFWDFLSISLTPAIIFKTMSYLYDTGSWSLFSFTVKGIFLVLIWFLEIGIILIVTWSAGTKQAEEPFSEQSNSWFNKKILPYYIKAPENLVDFLKSLKNGNSSILDSLEYDSQNSMNYFQVTTFSHSNEVTAFINFSNIKVSYDNDGKELNNETVLAKNIRVSLADLNRLEERFG